MNEHRNASDQLTIDFHSIEADMYELITEKVVSAFDLQPESSKTAGLDVVFQNFKVGSDIVGLEWDNWSGYIVNAKTSSAEPLAREIAGYISANFNS